MVGFRLGLWDSDGVFEKFFVRGVRVGTVFQERRGVSILNGKNLLALSREVGFFFGVIRFIFIMMSGDRSGSSVHVERN